MSCFHRSVNSVNVITCRVVRSPAPVERARSGHELRPYILARFMADFNVNYSGFSEGDSALSG
jgi:hypothetical protein